MLSRPVRHALFFAAVMLVAAYLFGDWEYYSFVFIGLIGIFTAWNGRQASCGKRDSGPLI